MTITLVVIGLIECAFALLLLKQDARIHKAAKKMDKRAAEMNESAKRVADSLEAAKEYFGDDHAAD